MARQRMLTGLLLALGLVVGAIAWRSVPVALGAVTGCAGTHWVGAWTAAPQSSSIGKADLGVLGLADGRERPFDDQTLRLVVAPRIGGEAVRLRLANRFGVAPVTLDAVTVAARASGASAAPGSVRPVTFGGSRTVTIPASGLVTSDTVAGPVDAFTELLVSIHVSGAAVLDFHQWATATHYVTAARAGDHTTATGGEAFVEKITSVYGLVGLDVLAPRSVGAVVALGDSITDGVGSSPDRDMRWPDQLARRLLDTTPLSVVNAGIGGNHVSNDGTHDPRFIGPAATKRFTADVVAVPGVTDVIVFEGINDIGSADPVTSSLRDQVIAGYRDLIRQGHAAGLRVIGATITPAGLRGFKETIRLEINRWIRTSGEFDAVLDFDRAVRDPSAWWRVRPEHDAHMAHLTDEGYRLLASSIDPTVFRGTAC